ncbi:MAG: hypothetical protein PUH70_11995 [Clostridiales bacterium]|nr:hypothetical protein [Clostridiales bacterium]
MKRLIMCAMMIVLTMFGTIGRSEWTEIPLRFNSNNDIEAFGHAYARKMPGNETYIIGRVIFKNRSDWDKWIQEAYISVFTEQEDGTTVNNTVLGEQKKIAPKIVERCGGMASMSFSGIVLEIPLEGLACQLNEKSVNSPFICSPRGIEKADIREDNNKNLVLSIQLDNPIKCDYDIGWGVIDKNGVLEWYEAGIMEEGEYKASITIPNDFRSGYLDNVVDIESAFAELYVHIDTYK